MKNLKDLHKMRCKIGRECRQQWKREVETLTANSMDLSEEEETALLLAVLGSGSRSVSEKEMQKILDMARDAKMQWGLFQMAALGMTELRLSKKGKLEIVLSPGAVEELGPQLDK